MVGAAIFHYINYFSLNIVLSGSSDHSDFKIKLKKTINIVKHTLFIGLQKHEIEDDVSKLLDNLMFTDNDKIIYIQKKNSNNKVLSIFLSIFH